jgi:membrane protease YdiL (CAAX protease family)
MKQIQKPTQFIAVTCAVSWIAAGAAILLGIREAKGAAYTVFAAAYMLLPAACAAFLQKIHKEKPLRNLNVSFRLNRWFLVAGLVPIAYAFAALGVSLLFPGVSFSSNYEGLLAMLPADQAELAAQKLARYPPIAFLLIQLGSALVAAYSVNAIFALGEELGWRGYLLKALRGKKLLPASLIIGCVWGLWHFPLILIGHNYPQHPAIGVGMMTVFCILLTPAMIYIVLKSKSVITAAIFHGSLNAIAGISVLYLAGGSDLINGVTGLAGFATMLLINLAFYAYDKYAAKENLFTRAIGEY